VSPRTPSNSLPVLPASESVLTPVEAAKFLRCSTSWLAKARQRGEGPPYVKIGRSVRYLKSALVQWMEEQ
jgi:predicted DNA-binding transcriptional regulator AlpA